MSQEYPCFLIVPTGEGILKLRRYVSSSTAKCSGPYSYHNAEAPIGRIPVRERADRMEDVDPLPEVSHDDPRWPSHCSCGYAFEPGDAWQVTYERIWKREETGEEFDLRQPPIGAMWDAYWYRVRGVGPDGLSLVLQTPGGPWFIDGQASNCTMKDDRQQLRHHCWIRHGVPPMLTVDKAGVTCDAGAGSIAAGSYHGFLRNGKLVP